jgi:hypothetical protein
MGTLIKRITVSTSRRKEANEDAKTQKKGKCAQLTGILSLKMGTKLSIDGSDRLS